MATKTISPEFAGKATSLIGQLNVLAQQNLELESAQKADLARTNQRLYQVLAGLYAHYLQVSNDKDLLNAVKAEMAKTLQEDKKVVHKKKTLNLFVRYVFNTDRQRTYNYVQVIKVAEHQNVAVENFADFVKTNGGIEKCKKLAIGTKKPTVNTKTDIYGDFHKANGSQTLARVSVPEELVQSLDQSKCVFLVGKANPSGIVDVIAVVPKQHDIFEKWAVKSIVSYKPDDLSTASESVNATNSNPAHSIQAEEHFAQEADHSLA
jgi:hypothetical protein